MKQEQLLRNARMSIIVAAMFPLLLHLSGCATHSALHVGERITRLSTPTRAGDMGSTNVVLECPTLVVNSSGKSAGETNLVYVRVPRSVFDRELRHAHPYTHNRVQPPTVDRRRILLRNVPGISDLIEIRQPYPDEEPPHDDPAWMPVAWYASCMDVDLPAFLIQREGCEYYARIDCGFPVHRSRTCWAMPARTILVPCAIIFDAVTSWIQIPAFSLGDSLNEGFGAHRGYNPWKDGP